MLQTHCIECEHIQENSTYTAEAHHILAVRAKTWFTFSQLIPAVCSALLGMLVVGRVVPGWVGVVALVSAIITAMGTVMNPQKSYFEHLAAARAFTVAKHDSRALREAFGAGMTDEESTGVVRCLHERYNELVRLSPPTRDWAFAKARKRIQAGVHRPDAYE